MVGKTPKGKEAGAAMFDPSNEEDTNQKKKRTKLRYVHTEERLRTRPENQKFMLHSYFY